MLEAKCVIINDLYCLLKDDIEGNLCEDLLHLSQKGIDICAGQVEKVIREVAETL